jgi:hypothetical protein
VICTRCRNATRKDPRSAEALRALDGHQEPRFDLPLKQREIRDVIYARRRRGDGPIVTLEHLRALNRTQWQVSDAELERHLVDALNEMANAADVADAIAEGAQDAA